MFIYFMCIRDIITFNTYNVSISYINYSQISHQIYLHCK